MALELGLEIYIALNRPMHVTLRVVPIQQCLLQPTVKLKETDFFLTKLVLHRLSLDALFPFKTQT